MLIDAAVIDIEPAIANDAADIQESNTHQKLCGNGEALALRRSGDGLMQSPGVVGARNGEFTQALFPTQ